LLYVLYLHQEEAISTNKVAITMAIIFVSDFLDGYLARKYQVTTFCGALFDGLADKFIIYAILLFNLKKQNLPFLPIYFLFVRDYLIVTLKHYATKKQIELEVVWSAKLKFALECLLSFSLLYKLENFSNLLLAAVVLVAWYSAIKYYFNFLKKCKL
jgi:CDP-diacylglycerol--glycerol-3-phosphate 3-phosphatidyltransferase/cardiolipin synthase